MHEIIERLDARIEQVEKTWVNDLFRKGYLEALKDIRLVAESITDVEEEKKND